MSLDFIPPSWRLLLFQADTAFGQPMTDKMNMGTLTAPLSTRQKVPNVENLGAGVLRVQATAVGVIASNWFLGLFDGPAEDGSNDPAGDVLLQLGTADGTESVPATVALVHLKDGQLNRLNYFAISTNGDGFAFQLDFWTYEEIEAWHRRVNGAAERAPSKPGCRC